MSNRSAREEILQRLRTAREKPSTDTEAAPPEDYALLETGIPSDPIAHFTALFTENHGIVRRFPHWEALLAQWPALQSELDTPFYSGPMEQALPGVPPLSDDTPLESVGTAFTECAALVAQTGSVVMTAREDPLRALSVYAPVHVIIARTAQILPTLQSAFDIYLPEKSSFFTLIGGPSRTADIEKTLVLGAHGPRRVEVWLLDN